MKRVQVLLAAAVFLAAGGCAQVGQQNGTPAPPVVPAVVFEPSDSSYLLSCVNELQGMKKKNFKRYYKDAGSRIQGGGDRDILRYVCLSLHPAADSRQFQRGKKLLREFIDGHPDASADMEGLFFLYSRIHKYRSTHSPDPPVEGREKIIAERDELAKEVETLQMQVKRDQGRIKELQGQIDELKNIESIIKNREH